MARGITNGRTARAEAAAGRSPRALTVLGLDPGLDRTGYAVIQMPAACILDAGIIRSKANISLPSRLIELSDSLDEILSENTLHLVAVEELYSHYKHPRTAILMAHARGVFLLAAARHGIELVSIPATRIKKFITGNGHAGKLQMQRAVMATFRLPRLPEPADVADALAIAWCAATLRAPSATSISAASVSPRLRRGVRSSRRFTAEALA